MSETGIEKWLIEYALNAPDTDTMKMLLIDILCGCTGAGNVEEIRQKTKWKRMMKKYKVPIPSAGRGIETPPDLKTREEPE